MEIFPNWTAIPVIALLLIFLFFLKRVFFDPLRKTLEDRNLRIEGAQKEAEEIRTASKDRLSDVDRRMRDARRESDTYMAQLRNQALTFFAQGLISHLHGAVEKSGLERKRSDHRRAPFGDRETAL